MKTGLTISTVGHAMLLAWGLVSFTSKPFDAAPADSLPVDIISASDFSQLTAGSKTAPKAAAPKPIVDKIGDPTPVKEQTPKVSNKQEIAAASEKAPAEPKPPEAKPDKKEPEPKIDPIAEALKKEEAKKKEAKKKEEARKRAEAKKREEAKFDPNKIENRLALLDKREAQRQAATGAVINRTASLGSPIGNAPQLSQNELDALRAQIEACWIVPAGAAEAQDLTVLVRIQLNKDGTLYEDPKLLNRNPSPYFQTAAESAMRAIRRCQPYKLPIAKYEAWRDVEVNFDPRNMFRG